MQPRISRRALLEASLAAAPSALIVTSACRAEHERAIKPRSVRALTLEISGLFSVDGAGVRLRRSIGSSAVPLLDPFLLLDEIHSSVPEEFVRGFPRHPHRGFETVTYMLDGAMEHRDSVGNHGFLVSGSAQWMTAGRGIVHSEMPRSDTGSLWGLQLWVNLPASDKMSAPRYQDVPPAHIPELSQSGCRVRLVAGTMGKERGPVAGIAVEPLMLDVSLPAKAVFEHEVVPTHTAFTYVLEGSVEVAGSASLKAGSLGVLGPGQLARLGSRQGGRALLIAGRPLNEPVARRGPFVMNTQAEIRQAFTDFHSGRLGQSRA